MVHRAVPTSLTHQCDRTRFPITSILNPTTPVAVNVPGVQNNTIRKNGREFHAWKAGKYPFPCDRVARDNEDILLAATHHFCYGSGGFNFSPLEKVMIAPLIGGNARLRKVLDLGCGSGLFIAATAPLFPDSLVVGVDLVGGQDMSVGARDLVSSGTRCVTDR
jgi:SAM-dependent methyltransferase